jgi:hypothetical protein
MKFKSVEVFSAIQGTLLCEIGRVYEVLNFLTGDNLFTHQLPRAGREAQPHVFKAFPKMETISMDGVGKNNWKEYAKRVEDALGEYIEITPIPRDDHAFKNPISEAIELVGKDRVIVAGGDI